MLSTIKNTLIELKERFKTMPIIYITILLLTGIVFFYQDVPDRFMPIILLSSTIVFFLSDCITNLSKGKKWIVSILAYAFISQIYYFFLTTYNSLIEQSALSLMYIYLFFSITLYLSSTKNYVLEIKSRVIHILISFALFIATYLFLYFSTFFIYTILSKNFDFFYSDSYASRIINSIATFAFFLILSIYKRKDNYTSSKFFTFVFSRLAPAMLILFLSLSIIYFIKIIILYDQKLYDYDFNYIASILSFMIFLILVMIQITGKIEKTLKVLFGFSVITSIMIAIFFLRYVKISSSIHYLIIYLLMAVYFLVVLLKTKKITYLASYVISIIILIYFTPVIGQFNYKEFIEEKDRTMVKNNIERNESYAKAREESKEEVYYSAPNSLEKVRWIIENENYKDILIDVSIWIYKSNKKDSESASFSYKDYEFNLSDDGKKLIVKNIERNSIEEFELYSEAKGNKKNARIIFNTEYFKIIISRYSFSNYFKNLNLNVYFYDNKK
ncbi:MAG: hypothetical protein ACTTKH_04060 [Treponema sp.]